MDLCVLDLFLLSYSPRSSDSCVEALAPGRLLAMSELLSLNSCSCF